MMIHTTLTVACGTILAMLSQAPLTVHSSIPSYQDKILWEDFSHMFHSHLFSVIKSPLTLREVYGKTLAGSSYNKTEVPLIGCESYGVMQTIGK